MNRKSKIIVSITGITLVLLILVSLTYAYFLTRIQGNTNNKSVSVTTAYLELVYNDGNGIISASKIEPGTEIDEKTFSVTNTGNVSVSYGVYIEDVINEFERTEDLELTLTCTSNKANTDCDGTTTTYPENNKKIISNDIAPSETQTYSLVLNYIEANVNQSVDMNKKLEGKVQIYGSERINLEFNIANSATGDYGILESTPKTSYATIEGSTGTYNFVGVEYGAHTLTIYDGNGEVKGTSPITISNGNTTSVSGSNITLPENTDGASIPVNNINAGSIELGNVTLYEKNNPYAVGTLAHAIIHNAQFVTDEEKELQYAEFMKTPLTKPAQSINKTAYRTYGTESTTDTNIEITPEQQEYYWTYSTSYTIDKNNGQYSLVSPQRCKYTENNCIRDLVNSGENVYIYSNVPGTFTKSSNSSGTTKGTSNIYRINSAPEVDSESNITLVTIKITNIRYSVENILSITEENEGTSYYYRGDVKNNYLNFNNMCWRIVRIDNEGGIKLILASQAGNCSNETLSIDNSGYMRNSSGSLLSYKYGQISKTLITPSGNSKTVSIPDYLNSDGMNSQLQSWFIKNNFDTTKLQFSIWCLGNLTDVYNSKGIKYELTSDMIDGNGNHYEDVTDYLLASSNIFYYESSVRTRGLGTSRYATLNCNEKNDENFSSYIGTLTIDEVIFAGSKIDSANNYYYINNGNKSNFWKLLSTSGYDGRDYIGVSYVNTSDANRGRILDIWPSAPYMIRPVIVLEPNIEINSGNGSLEEPYEVE